MKHTTILLLLIFAYINFNVSVAQNSLNSAGGDATGASGSVSFSIGQIAYTTISNPLISVSQGVQQAYEVSQVSIDESFVHQILIYPNPTNDLIQISVENPVDLCYELSDEFGKVLSVGRFHLQANSLSINEYPPATYFLRIQEDSTGKSTIFKIIKF